jgi:hypothetical protein
MERVREVRYAIHALPLYEALPFYGPQTMPWTRDAIS